MLKYLLEVVLQAGFLQHQGLGAGAETNEILRGQKFEDDKFRKP